MRCPNCSHEWTPTSSELAAEMGRKGGSQTSRKKTRAAKLNAKLGGWPKGKKRGKRKPRPLGPNEPAYSVGQALEKLARYGDANTVAHSVVAKAEKLTQQGRPPQRLKVLPNPKSPRRAS